MNTEAINLPRRYPGLKPFERSQQAVFHGRQDDVQRLSHLMLRERLVVLFSKSGIGKTSLLQAGVAPELERQDYVPILLRTERSDHPILERLASSLTATPEHSGQDTTGLRADTPQTLWEQMKRHEFDIDGLPATPVLIFDQFEETFTLSHTEKSRNDFLNELADLANGTMPETLRSELLQRFQAGEISMETMQWWEQQPDLRIVLSIRSDFLHMIDGMSDRIPGILKNRYQLLPLNREKARTAIVMPASASGAFASPKFCYTESALSEMIEFLAGDTSAEKEGYDPELQGNAKRNEIEAVNLQIVCMDVEERVIDYQKEENFEVASDFYNGIDGLRLSIRNFYANQLRAFPKAFTERLLQKAQLSASLSATDKELNAREPQELQDLAQRLIEESLITPGNRRNSVVDDTLIDEYEVSMDFLDTLVDKSRLLRKEPRLDDFYYEISHDTLLPAIIESRNRRRNKEKADLEKLAYESRIAEEEKRREAIELELKTARKQRKLARIVAFLSFVSLLVSLAFGVWFARDYMLSMQELLRSAEDNVYVEQFDAAEKSYSALSMSRRRQWVLQNPMPWLVNREFPPKDVGTESEIVEALHNAYTRSMDSMHRADGLMFRDSFADAFHTYRSAMAELLIYRQLVADNYRTMADAPDAPRVDTSKIDNRIALLAGRKDNAWKTLLREFTISQRDFEVFYEAKMWGQAHRQLQRMKQLLPKDPESKLELQRLQQLNMPIDKYLEAQITYSRRKMGAKN
jgi:hypothetical protein